MKVKALTWALLTKISMGNPNASLTEGNVQTAKKITTPDGSQIDYISGQCQRHGMKERLVDKGFEMSTPIDGEVETTMCDPVEYIDDDLFGYLDAKGRKKRTSPLRIAPMISLFPYRGDRDLLTKTRKATDRGGNMVETEIYSTILRGGGLLELDRVGCFQETEVKENSSLDTTNSTKIERINATLDVMKHIWTGGKQTNMLTDISPKFIVFAFTTEKVPFLLEYLKADEKGNIDQNGLKEALTNAGEIIDEVIIGTTGVFNTEGINEEEFDKTTILPINEAFDKVKEKVEKLFAE
ncbi:MAG: type I-B CRISPR-associated protein Cas7/Cst2/DevR [Kosmotogaceae bacterium]